MDLCNGNKYNLIHDFISPPTYLKEFFIDEDQIVLVYDKKDIQIEEVSCTDIIKNNNSALNLTGDPLKVDLEGDDTLEPYVSSEKPYNWSIEESHHYPLSLNDARSYLNRENRIKKHEGEKQLPVYVVTDGKDSLHTVLLGSQKQKNLIMTTLVNILGCFPKDHEIISLKAIEMDHIQNTYHKNPKIDFLVKFRYYLYGNVVKMHKNVNELDHHGCISVEVICNKCVYDVPQHPSSVKMIMQVVVGHNISSVHFLWEELILLQTYLEILCDSDKCNDELTVITNNSLEESDIYNSISNLIATNFLKREAKLKFDLQHIRQEMFLDKLWYILKRCENLSALRDCIHYFFEELVEAEVNIKIHENDKSYIATIINGIVNGKIAVPTLSFSQALECLFELGAEKLKNDYQAILKNYYSLSDQTVSLKWSKFQHEELTSQGFRKTRVTVNLKSGVSDMTRNQSKLAYLGKLHITTELIYLVKDQTEIPEETFDYICERVYKNYVHDGSDLQDFVDLYNAPLCQFSISLNTADTDIIEKVLPVTRTLKMSSKVGNMEITTIYHISEFPIFPNVIYNDYDLSHVTGEDKMVYYVSKLIRHKEFL